MGDIKSRLKSQGISVEHFVFQFIVVLMGVYLAIVMEGWADDRGRVNDAEAILGSIAGELALDAEEIADVIEVQGEMVRASATLSDLLMEESGSNAPTITSLMGALSFNPTVFPRRSAYAALVSSGGMGYVADDDLLRQIANLYEHIYVRMQNQGDLLDAKIEGRRGPFLARHWDPATRQITLDDEAVLREFRNLVGEIGATHANYEARLREALETVTDVEARIERHLAR